MNTMEEILDRMLAQVPEEYDTREGSVLYNSLAPCAVALSDFHAKIGEFREEVFAETASRPFLEKRAAEVGIYPYPSTNAVVIADFNVEIEEGTRFSCGDTTFSAREHTKSISLTSPFSRKMTCEEPGEIGNIATAGTRIIPIDNVEGLTIAEVWTVLQPGADEEDTEDFRKRFFDQIKYAKTHGSVQDYVNFVKSVAGVGQVKIYTNTPQKGDVKVLFADTQNHNVNFDLERELQAILDPTQDGGGAGWSPIGQTVTVKYATSLPIQFSASANVKSGTDEEKLTEAVNIIFGEYVKSINKTWENVPWREDKTAAQRIYRGDIVVLFTKIPEIISVQNIAVTVDREINLDITGFCDLRADHLANFGGVELAIF